MSRRSPSPYAMEMFDVIFLMSFFFYFVNNHFYHQGYISHENYAMMIGIVFAASVVSLIIRWVTILFYGPRSLTVRIAVSIAKIIAGIALIMLLFNYRLINEEWYRLLCMSSTVILIFLITNWKIQRPDKSRSSGVTSQLRNGNSSEENRWT